MALLLIGGLIVPYPFFSLLNNIEFPAESVAASTTSTNLEDWVAGEFDGTSEEEVNGSIQLVADGNWEPLSWEYPPRSLSAGATYVSDGTYIYLIRGAGDSIFYRYTSTEDSWDEMKEAPYGTYYGAEMVVIDRYIYATFGGYQKKFARYDRDNDFWSVLADTPDLQYNGTSLTTDGTDIYMVRGGSTDVYYYDVSEDEWFTKAEFPVSVSYGDVAYKDGFLYDIDTANPNRVWKYKVSDGTYEQIATMQARSTNESEYALIGNFLYIPVVNTQNFYRLDIGNGTWTELASTPQTMSTGGGLVYHAKDGYIYFFRGGSQDMWKYDIADDKFLGPIDSPVNLYRGSDIFRYNGKFYVARGYNSKTMYEFDYTTNTWTQKADAPDNIYYYNRGVVAGANIYMMQGNSSLFWSYNPTTNTWDETLDDLDLSSSEGVLAYPGSGDYQNYIYATRGGGGSFWRYSISENSWSDESVADLPVGVSSRHGASMTSDGTNLYLILGGGTPGFYMYSLEDDEWAALPDAPFAAAINTDSVYVDGKIYAIEGNYEDGLFEYDIEGESWRRMPNMPETFGYRYGTHYGGSIEFDGVSTLYITKGSAQYDIMRFNLSADNYPESGTWTSPDYDLEYVSSWTSLSTTISTPGDSSITFQSRTSSDRHTWSEWANVDSGNIGSPVARYIQIKATFTATSDQTETPTLSEMTINYTGDNTDPDNPGAVSTALSQQVGGVAITSGNSYSYSNPYFTFSGSDAETGVAGYYVYFGTTSDGNPKTAGSFHSSGTYTVTEEMSQATYYLRVITKDAAGNEADATTLFEYTYAGVPGETSLTVDETDEFSGTSSNTSTSGDKITLASTDGFWQPERLSLAPGGLRYGSKTWAYVSATDKIYVFRGANSVEFYEYNITTDVWSTLASAPSEVQMDGGVVEGPAGYLYGFAGNNTSKVWRYDIQANTWNDAEAMDALNNINYGGAFIYDGSRYIYALRGDSDDAFWRFDTQSGSSGNWATLAAVDFGSPANNVNNAVYYGGDLAYDGNNTIYAIQGNYRNGFSSYSITGGTWTTLVPLPTLAQNGAAIEYYSDSNSIYLLAGNGTADFFKYDIASGTWTELDDAPYQMNYGANIRRIGDRLYVSRGGDGREVYIYNPENDSWMVPNRNIFGHMYDGSTINTVTDGSAMAQAGNNLYMAMGNYRNLFVRYNTSTGVVEELANLPSGSYRGATLVYDSGRNRVYYHPGNYWNHYYYYDVATNTWTEDVGDAPTCTPNYASHGVSDGARYLYYTCGGSSTTFLRFDPIGTEGAKWSARANLLGGASWGSDLVHKDGYIYYTRGGNNTGFYRYDPSQGDTGTWSNEAVADATNPIHVDGWMVDGGDGYLYVHSGNNTTVFSRYSLATDIWETIASSPANVTYGAVADAGGNSKIYMFTGSGTNTFNNGLYIFVQQTETTSFEGSGTYTSQSHNLSGLYKWGNLKVNYTTASDSTLTVQTRTSADNSTWSSWADTSQQKITGSDYEYKVNSNPAQYIQVKFTLTSSSNIYSGVVNSYVINYYQDGSAPANPTGFFAYTDSGKLTELGLSGNWYNHPNPTFDWPDAEDDGGATDTSTGSGVVGYYVYFGTVMTGDPFEDGEYITDTEYSASSLISGETYYFKIATVDDAGNTQSTPWSAYTYKYDSVNPTSPTELEADPSGYSATNSFDFSWATSTDEGSEVSHYCFKTGASEGTWASDQCQAAADTDVTSVPSYRNGANTFYVRAKDTSGNYSEYTTVSYYYNTGAPSAPQNLNVTPEVSTTNSFAFSWSTPGVYLGNVSNIKYYYSINAIPTANSVSETTATSLSASAFATLPGDNTFYVVAKDEAGNIDYSNYTSITFTANTTAPGIPNNIDIADVSVKATSSWKLAISWEAPSSVGAGVSSYRVYRSTNGTNYSYIASTAGISHVDTNLVQQDYYYKVQACDSANNCGAYSSEVSLYPDGKFTEAAPLVGEPEATGITTRTAKVSWTTSRTSDSKIQYGTSSESYFDEEVSNSQHVTGHILTLSNLEPGTTYYYKAKWTDEDGNTGISEEYSFATEPAPTVQEVKVASVSINNALITFKVSGASSVKLYYGESTSFGGIYELTTSTAESTYTIQLEGLKDGTVYYYKINTFDVDGYEYDGTTLDFETLPRPRISNVKLQQVLGTAQPTVLVAWQTNTEISSIVTYYPLDNPQAVRDEVNIALKKGNHQMLIRGLSPNSVYSLTVKGRDKIGNEAVSDPLSLTTASDTRAPQIADLKIEGTSKTASSESESQSQLVVSWNTDEPGTSQVEFGEGTGSNYSQKTQEDSNYTLNHLVVISGLTPSKVYHLRAISKDIAGNEGKSIDTVTITPKSTKSALDLVVNNLSEAFGFLK